MKTPISIRFPMTKEKTGNRRGPRFRRVPDKSALNGAARCAAGMVACAILKRDSSLRIDAWHKDPSAAQVIDRAAMRSHALWARLFAGQIADNDPRLAAAQARHTELVRAYCGNSLAA
jgi:hypothetical protein